MSATNFIRTAAIVTLVLLATGLASAHPPTGIVVDKQGRIYFSDLETIWKFADGKLTVFRAGGPGRHVHELAIDGDGSVYGADVNYDEATKKYLTAVWKMTSEGRLTWLEESSDNSKTGINLWIDRAGNMYSVDQNNHTKTRTVLLKRAPDGTVTTFAGGAYGYADGKGTAAKFGSVGALTIAPDGNIYLTDGTSVRKVTPDGTVTTIARDVEVTNSDDSQRPSFTGLSVDSSGNMYVADPGRRRLLKAKPEGKFEVVYRGEAPYFPNGVYATAEGAIYVLEAGLIPPSTNIAPRVRKISRDGTNVVLVTLGETVQEGSENSSGSIGTGGIGIVAGGISRIVFVVAGAFLVGAVLIVVVWRRRRHRTQRA